MKQIRLWKVGNIDPKNIGGSYIPSSEYLKKIRSMIAEVSSLPSGTANLILGPDITFETIDITGRNFIVNADGKLEEL